MLNATWLFERGLFCSKDIVHSHRSKQDCSRVTSLQCGSHLVLCESDNVSLFHLHSFKSSKCAFFSFCDAGENYLHLLAETYLESNLERKLKAQGAECALWFVIV